MPRVFAPAMPIPNKKQTNRLIWLVLPEQGDAVENIADELATNSIEPSIL